MLTETEEGVAALVANITEKACTTPEEQRTTIVIISGNAKVIPAIERVLKYKGWKVEMYMWENAVSSDLPQEITFTNVKFDPKYLQGIEKDAVAFQNGAKCLSCLGSGAT